MPSSKKPRKRYRPEIPQHVSKAVRDRLNGQRIGVTLRKSNTEKFNDKEIMEMHRMSLLAIDAVAKGKAEQNDVHQLAFMANLTLLLCERGFGKDLIERVKTGQRHLAQLHGRLERGESLLLTGPGITAVRDLIAVHEAQIECEDFTSGIAYTATMDILKRMQEGHVFTTDVGVVDEA